MRYFAFTSRPTRAAVAASVSPLAWNFCSVSTRSICLRSTRTTCFDFDSSVSQMRRACEPRFCSPYFDSSAKSTTAATGRASRGRAFRDFRETSSSRLFVDRLWQPSSSAGIRIAIRKRFMPSPWSALRLEAREGDGLEGVLRRLLRVFGGVADDRLGGPEEALDAVVALLARLARPGPGLVAARPVDDPGGEFDADIEPEALHGLAPEGDLAVDEPLHAELRADLLRLDLLDLLGGSEAQLLEV